MAKKYSMKGGGAKIIGFGLVVVIVISVIVYFKYFRDDEEEGSSASGANTNPANTNPANTNPANTNPANTNPANTNPANTNSTNPANTNPTNPANPNSTNPANPNSTNPANPNSTNPANPNPTNPANTNPTNPANSNAGSGNSNVAQPCTGVVDWSASRLDGQPCQGGYDSVLTRDSNGGEVAAIRWCVRANCTLSGDYECNGSVDWPESELNGMSCGEAMGSVVQENRDDGVDDDEAIASGYTWCVAARNNGCTLEAAN